MRLKPAFDVLMLRLEAPFLPSFTPRWPFGRLCSHGCCFSSLQVKLLCHWCWPKSFVWYSGLIQLGDPILRRFSGHPRRRLSRRQWLSILGVFCGLALTGLDAKSLGSEVFAGSLMIAAGSGRTWENQASRDPLLGSKLFQHASNITQLHAFNDPPPTMEAYTGVELTLWGP